MVQILVPAVYPKDFQKVMMNELNIIKAQEVAREPNSDGISKKNKNMVRKGNDRSKKRNSMDSSGPSGPATKRQGLVGIRLQNKEYCLIVFCNCVMSQQSLCNKLDKLCIKITCTCFF